MKHLWLAAVTMAMLPIVASAGDRGDRHRGGRSHYDRGDRYEHRGQGRQYYDHGNRHGHRSHSNSSFDFSFGFSSGGYHGGDYSSFRYTYGNYHPVYRERVYVEPSVVVVQEPAYCPPPAVIYAPPPRVHYYTPRYYYSGHYSYCR